MNEFTNEYNSLISINNHSFEVYEPIEGYQILKFNPTLEEINLNLKMAKEKATFLNSYSQNEKKRGKYEKINKAFQGMMAEYAVHSFLLHYMNIPFTNIKRYDVERKDFSSNYNEEYDISIVNNRNETLVGEIRSSIKKDNNYITTIHNYHLIGPYSNRNKGNNEKLCDFYIRPLYHLLDDSFSVFNDSLAKGLYENKISIDIITGALKYDFDNLSTETNFKQKSNYLVIEHQKLGGINNFIQKLTNELK